MMNQAKELIDNDTYSCVVVRDDNILHEIEGKGVKPLLDIYIKNKEDLENSFIADKVIGKAAATIIICGKVKSVYGKLMSRSAIDLLSNYNVEFEYEELVEKIHNRDKTDMCPLEKTVSLYENPHEGLEALKGFLKM